MTNDYTNELGPILGILAAFFLIFFFIAIAMYVIQAIALSTIGKRNGFKYWWFAWIPVLNSLVLPMLVEDDVHESIRGKFTLIFVASFFGSIFLSLLFPPLAYLPVALTYYAFYIIATWYSRNAPAHLIVAVFTLGISMPISLLMMAGKERL